MEFRQGTIDDLDNICSLIEAAIKTMEAQGIHQWDELFLICGYEQGKAISLILGEYQNGKLVYAGTVSWGVRREVIKALTKGNCPFRENVKLNGDVVWCKPEKTCIVEYMPNTLDALRQPVFKGIRDDV